ncbi:NADH dehydrogenase [ubiquinone] 1 alpha subcomplex assembly factor 3-like [Mercenaria mercenaria]|uniref:NADH dehydrogenase [ubiquinone] 1 alpha subcomplex assembly factor 3-like n=1 Tax=Mercenaria mercenaria TaxID=6596 RepID=UPI00234EABF0|nr:NADH dehydrogenase [ubiquinone] 1 alpha subcomplex assembly factor 3-like [Mercenaria mercenaria]
MSLRRIVKNWTLLSKNHHCNRHFVRFRKRTKAPEVIEKYLDPEMHPSLSSKMTLLSQQEDDHIYITRYSGLGFGLQNNVRLSGPTVFFPRNALKWKIFRPSDINERSLSLFSLITPKLDLVIIGTGSHKQELSKDTIKFLRQNRINFEVMASDKAVAAFNFQNNDQRWIAAAILPPEESQNDLLDYIQNVYDDILDSTDMIYSEEKELPRIRNTDKTKTQKLEDPQKGAEKIKQLPDDSTEDTEADTVVEVKESDVHFVKSPLGQSLDFLSSDSIVREVTDDQKVKRKTLNKKRYSEERKIEDKDTK